MGHDGDAGVQELLTGVLPGVRVLVVDLHRLGHGLQVPLGHRQVQGEPVRPVVFEHGQEVVLGVDIVHQQRGADAEPVRQIGLLVTGDGNIILHGGLRSVSDSYFKSEG